MHWWEWILSPCCLLRLFEVHVPRDKRHTTVIIRVQDFKFETASKTVPVRVPVHVGL